MAKVKQGKVITVTNKDRKFGANEEYYASGLKTIKNKKNAFYLQSTSLW